MTVYVDDMYRSPRGRVKKMLLSRMMADTSEELLAMADRLGISRDWIINAGTAFEHFTVTFSKRRIAVDADAQEISMGRFDELTRARAKPGEVDWHPSVRAAQQRANSRNHGAISTGR